MRPARPRSSAPAPILPARRAASLAAVETAPRLELPFRLRHALLVGVLVVGGLTLWPRGQAAFALHDLAVKKADHALCLAGPTGPGLLRDNPGALTELLRRRLIRAGPDERPFAACSQLADGIPMAHASAKAHQQVAAAFVEYRLSARAPAEFSVTQFDFQLKDLEVLAERAWPFARGNPLELVQASRHAKEAPHPAPIPRPGWGRGLPGGRYQYRSTLAREGKVVGAFGSGANARTLVSADGGVSWHPSAREAARDVLDRCPTEQEGRAYSLSLTETGRQVVLSQGPEGPPQASILSEADETVVSVSCDAAALVAVLTQQKDALGRRPVRLRICPFRLPCRDLSAPDRHQPLDYPVDVARVLGDTIVSRSFDGVTRVTSTRDDGRTWAPWIVAFDATSAGLAPGMAPVQLLKVADRVLLLGRARVAEEPYTLLVSDDHGASFHAPESSLAPGGLNPGDGVEVAGRRRRD